MKTWKITLLSANTFKIELCSYDINCKWISFNLSAQACLIPLRYRSKQIYSIYLHRPDNVRTPTEKGDLWWRRAVTQEKQFFDWLSPCFLITLGFCRSWFTLAWQLFGPCPCLGGTLQWVFHLCRIGRVMIGTVQTAISACQTMVPEHWWMLL